MTENARRLQDLYPTFKSVLSVAPAKNEQAISCGIALSCKQDANIYRIKQLEPVSRSCFGAESDDLVHYFNPASWLPWQPVLHLATRI
eukprot:scaffold395216_cov18-Prasinocladus_malaysianus.AAC.1